MTSVFYKISAVLLTFLVVFSTISLTVEKHFCGNNLVDVSVFSSAKKCGMEHSDSTKPELKKKSCCKDVVQVISGQNQLDVKTLEDLTSVQKNLVSAFLYSYKSLFEPAPKKTEPYLHYKTPPLIYDIALLDQVFLI